MHGQFVDGDRNLFNRNLYIDTKKDVYPQTATKVVYLFVVNPYIAPSAR